MTIVSHGDVGGNTQQPCLLALIYLSLQLMVPLIHISSYILLHFHALLVVFVHVILYIFIPLIQPRTLLLMC